MRAWVNGHLLTDPTAPAVRGQRPRADRRRRGLRGGQGRRRPAVRARPAPRAARSGRRRGSGCRRVDDGGGTPRGRRPCSTESSCRWARLRITYTGGPAPLGSGRGDAPPTLVVVADADAALARDDRGRDGAVAAQRAGRAGRPQDHVVRRERRRSRRTPSERGASEAIFANLAGPPVRGHRLQRLLRRRRRAADADAGERLPGRRDPGADPGVVRRPRGRRADRGRASGRARCSWRRRPATSRPSPAGTTASCSAPGPVTTEAREVWRSASRSYWTLSHRGCDRADRALKFRPQSESASALSGRLAQW